MQAPLKWSTKRKSSRTVQLLTAAAAATALLYCFTTLDSPAHDSGTDQQRHVPPSRPLTRLPPELLRDPDPEWLFDLPAFRYLLQSRSCGFSSRSHPDDDLRFAVLIHSKPEHFRQRQVIRTTWGSSPGLRTVFLLGLEPVWNRSAGMDTERLLHLENQRYGDLVQGNFVDTYRNLSYKHVMAFKWLVDHCLYHVDYVIKADDDAFIDIYQLREYLRRTFLQIPPDTILCNVFHQGSSVLRHGRYAVDIEQYPWKNYPRFCGGLAYVTTPSLARKLLQASPLIPFLWVDDVYVTGLLAQAVGAKHFSLNVRYSYNVTDEDDVVVVVGGGQPKSLPFIIGELDTTRSDWRQTAEKLWQKSIAQRT